MAYICCFGKNPISFPLNLTHPPGQRPSLTPLGLRFFEKISENAFSPKNGCAEKLMEPSESASQELSNEN
jgi:hypothetical protein